MSDLSNESSNEGQAMEIERLSAVLRDTNQNREMLAAQSEIVTDHLPPADYLADSRNLLNEAASAPEKNEAQELLSNDDDPLVVEDSSSLGTDKEPMQSRIHRQADDRAGSETG